MLKPLNFNKDSAGTALVELKEQGTIETPDKQFKAYDRGIVISINDDARGNGDIVDKEIFFEEFKSIAKIEEGDKTYAFVALEDVKGFRDE
jgi:hypothetical protein